MGVVFGLRMRKKANLEARFERCESVMPSVGEEIRGGWRDRFGYKRICVEIGCGKGRFITENAKKNPETLFIGIERERGALVMAAEKAVSQKIPNVQFLDMDAQEICSFFADGEIDGIYLNFSDPWPKKKQAKRRLTHENFLRLYDRVLKPAGFLFFKTDNEKLFEFSLNSMSDYGLYLRNITFDLANTDFDNIMTEYEERFTKLGQNIFRVEAYKRQGGAEA